ncbi:MAG TPA: septal ring lytic transglycosylase RlpA family protein [Steroidobacteraceae bacterium]|jgi:rare lipoprotein A
MSFISRCSNLVTAAIAATLVTATCALTAQASTPDPGTTTKSSEAPKSEAASHKLSPNANAPLDRSGKKRVGKASFYAPMFAGRKMADGTKMDPLDNNAASRTLPLGTTAKVTNLETGKSAFVTIQDRGPYVDGRIVDLSPATAREIGLSHRKGVARVEVSPLAVPLPNGGVKLGAAGQAVLARNDRALRQFPPVGW